MNRTATPDDLLDPMTAHRSPHPQDALDVGELVAAVVVVLVVPYIALVYWVVDKVSAVLI